MDFIEIYKKLTSVDSTSGNETEVKNVIRQLLNDYQIKEDSKGNLIIDIKGEGKPILLNAHLDRVPPGKANVPIINNDIVISDKTTNLGADDCVGLAIIISILKQIKNKKHRALKIILTVEEEMGFCGATEVNFHDLKDIAEGIVVDNAFPYYQNKDGGVIVDKGAAIYTFDLKITGIGGHSGKDLSKTINVINVFNNMNFPLGSLNDDKVRVNLGNIIIGEDRIRNKIPERLMAYGEIRSVMSEKLTKSFISEFKKNILSSVEKSNAKAALKITKIANACFIDKQQPLIKEYENVLKKRSAGLKGYPTFIGSDCQAFRAKGIQTFTISTGVDKEHTVDEEFSISYAAQIISDLVDLLCKA